LESLEEAGWLVTDADENNFFALHSSTKAVELLQGVLIDVAVAWSWDLVFQDDEVFLRVDGADLVHVYRGSVS